MRCRGRFARASANYPPQLEELVWDALNGRVGRHGHACAAAAVRATGAPSEHHHREHDSFPSRPLWCALVTRIVRPKSGEASCACAKAAMQKGLDSMKSKRVWDLDDVYFLPDLLRGPKISEAMLGRVCSILVVKGEELGPDERVWKARIVFQGSNIGTKSGTFAADLFEEVSDAPASFLAARTALGVAALRGFRATLRDAESAFWQALIDTGARTPTFVELPCDWWPDT